MSNDRPNRSELMQALSRAGRDLSTATIMFHSALADRLELNPTDHKALDMIMRTGPLTAGQLAELTGLTTGAITGVVDRLERAGFVRREQDAHDRRRVIIQPLMEEAQRHISPLFASLQQATTELASRYSDQELAVVLDFIEQAIPILKAETAKLRSEATPDKRTSGVTMAEG